MRRSRSEAETRVLYSGFRYHHHNQGSGYDAVVADPHHYVSSERLPFADYAETTITRYINFLLVDLITLARGLRYDTVHYFYPEITAYLSPWLLRLLGKRIVFTVHLTESDWLGPPRSALHKFRQRSLGAAHAIAVLSRSQRAIYSQAFPDKEVIFVPHGHAFDSASAFSDELFERRLRNRRLVVVGVTYRDLDLLERIVLQRGSREVAIHLVGMNDAVRHRFEPHECVTYHPRLDPTTYDELLRESFALLLPLTFATANNALLEAYDCYLPVFASRVHGIADYAVDGDRSLFSSPEEFWSKYDALAGLSADDLRDWCGELREMAKDRFSWPNIRAQLAQLYTSNSLPEHGL